MPPLATREEAQIWRDGLLAITNRLLGAQSRYHDQRLAFLRHANYATAYRLACAVARERMLETMQREAFGMGPEKLRAWLQTFAPDAIVGTRGDGQDCPAARAIMAPGVLPEYIADACVGPASAMIDFGAHEAGVTVYLGPVLESFVGYVDRDGDLDRWGLEVSAAEALEYLDRAERDHDGGRVAVDEALLREFAAQAGTSFEYAWAILVRQQQLLGVRYVVSPALFVAAVAIELRLAYGWVQGWVQDHPDDDGCQPFALLGAALVGFLTTAGLMISVWDGLFHLLNPEYYALDAILKAMAEARR